MPRYIYKLFVSIFLANYCISLWNSKIVVSGRHISLKKGLVSPEEGHNIANRVSPSVPSIQKDATVYKRPPAGGTVNTKTLKELKTLASKIFTHHYDTKHSGPPISSRRGNMGSEDQRDALSRFKVITRAKLQEYHCSSATIRVTDGKGTHEKEGLQKPNCSEFHLAKPKVNTNVTAHCHRPNDSLTCFQDPIFCETYHLSGQRDQTWPIYGEYSYLPHEHWFKVLQHGGVAFLYHPCLDNSLVSELRSLASQCLRRYVMTPYSKLDPKQPIALVTWGCYILMSTVDYHSSKHWMRRHAFKGPSTHVHKNGNFKKKLVSPSQVVTDIQDTFLCPDESEKAPFLPSPRTVKKEPILGEKLILHRLEKAKHRKVTSHRNVIPTKINKSNAAWAVGSLLFLCGLLVALMIHTKLWEGSQGTKYRYSAVYEDDQEFAPPKKRKFNLMKSSQGIIRKMRRKKGKRGEQRSEMKLLTPIDEENEESSDGF